MPFLLKLSRRAAGPLQPLGGLRPLLLCSTKRTFVDPSERPERPDSANAATTPPGTGTRRRTEDSGA
eukprot:775690-Alexandrium_andersonii.AAC.1